MTEDTDLSEGEIKALNAILAEFTHKQEVL